MFGWLRRYVTKRKSSIIVYQDNHETITMASTSVTKRSEHIDIQYHFIKDLVSENVIKIIHVCSEEQIAIMTKGLNINKF